MEAWPPRIALRNVLVAWALLGLPAVVGGLIWVFKGGGILAAGVIVWGGLFTAITILVVVLMVAMLRTGRAAPTLPSPRRPMRTRTLGLRTALVLMPSAASYFLTDGLLDFAPLENWLVFLSVAGVVFIVLVGFEVGRGHVALARLAAAHGWRMREGSLAVPPRLRIVPGTAAVIITGKARDIPFEAAIVTQGEGQTRVVAAVPWPGGRPRVPAWIDADVRGGDLVGTAPGAQEALGPLVAALTLARTLQ